jgi:membrane protein DedA with SNARE-associated domain
MTHLFTTSGYLALVVIALLATMGIPTGSELAIAFAGALAIGKIAHAPHFNLLLVILLASLAELTGSYLGYAIGRLGGRPLLKRLGRVVRVTDRDLDRCERLLARYGKSFVLFGRFIPLVRSFVGVVAGLGRMAFVPYTVFTALAVAIWCTGLAVLGDVLGRQWHHVFGVVGPVGYALVGAGVVAVPVLYAVRLRRAELTRPAASGLAEVEAAGSVISSERAGSYSDAAAHHASR